MGEKMGKVASQKWNNLSGILVVHQLNYAKLTVRSQSHNYNVFAIDWLIFQ